jgi:hypothetical protein
VASTPHRTRIRDLEACSIQKEADVGVRKSSGKNKKSKGPAARNTVSRDDARRHDQQSRGKERKR